MNTLSRKRRRRGGFVLAALALPLLALGCYELASTRVLLSSAPAWSGTGTRGIGSYKYSVGLAGQDVYHFKPYDHFVQRAPFLSLFGGAHNLTSYVQNRDASFHETEFIHGNLAGRTDNLRLLYKSNPANTATWVEPAWSLFAHQGESYRIVQICGLAAAETSNYVTSDSAGSHLFMSFRAQATSSGRYVSGVLEVETDSRPAHWWIRSGSAGLHVALRRANGALFANECMPLSVTSDPALSRQYLAVGSPLWDEITIFDAFRLWSGAIDSWRQDDWTRSMVDLVIEGRRVGDLDVAFLVTLWDGQTNRLLRHYTVTNGDGSADPFLEETLQPHVRLIESSAPRVIHDSADLYVYGSNVQLRTYREQE